MPAPVVSTRGVSQNAAATTSHTVNFPASLTTGHKVLCAFESQGGAGEDATFPEGWTRLSEAGTGGGGNNYLCFAEYTVVGGEDATFTVTTIDTVESAHYTWAGPFGTIVAAPIPPTFGSGTAATYAGVSGLDSDDYLFLSVVGCNDNTGITAPADYVEERIQDTGGGDSVTLRVAENPLTGVTGETPGDSTLSTTESWVTLTVAVANPEVGGGGFQAAWANSNVVIQ